jgi:hypothetical protein
MVKKSLRTDVNANNCEALWTSGEKMKAVRKI